MEAAASGAWRGRVAARLASLTGLAFTQSSRTTPPKGAAASSSMEGTDLSLIHGGIPHQPPHTRPDGVGSDAPIAATRSPPSSQKASKRNHGEEKRRRLGGSLAAPEKTRPSDPPLGSGHTQNAKTRRVCSGWLKNRHRGLPNGNRSCVKPLTGAYRTQTQSVPFVITAATSSASSHARRRARSRSTAASTGSTTAAVPAAEPSRTPHRERSQHRRTIPTQTANRIIRRRRRRNPTPQ